MRPRDDLPALRSYRRTEALLTAGGGEFVNRRFAGLRRVLGLGCLGAPLALAAVGCNNGQDALGPEPNASGPGVQPSSTAAPPCSDALDAEASCEPRDVSAIDYGQSTASTTRPAIDRRIKARDPMHAIKVPQ